MKPSRTISAALILILGSSSLLAERAGRIRTTNAVPFEKVTSGSYMDRLDGDAAKKHLDNLRAQHPGVFQKAAATLLARGYVDTGKVVVLRANRAAKARGETRRDPAVLADTAYLDEGEVILWEWYDGNDDNWEGNVHVLDYVTGNWINVDAQLWTTEAQQMQEIWSEPIDGYEREPIIIEANGLGRRDLRSTRPDAPSGIQLASFKVTNPSIRPASIDWYTIRRKWEDYSWCVAFGCGASAMTCHTFRERRAVAGCVVFNCTIFAGGCMIMLR